MRTIILDNNPEEFGKMFPWYFVCPGCSSDNGFDDNSKYFKYPQEPYTCGCGMSFILMKDGEIPKDWDRQAKDKRDDIFRDMF